MRAVLVWTTVLCLLAVPALAQMGGMGRCGKAQVMKGGMMDGMKGLGGCMMGSCWKGPGAMGMAGGHRARMHAGCPGPAMVIRAAMAEIKGYLRGIHALDLTGPQLGTLKDIEHDLSVALIEKQADLQVAVLGLQRLMDQDAPDLQAIRGHIDSMGKTETEIQKIAVEAALEARKVLTADQILKARHMGVASCPNDAEDEDGQ
jgi:Spy/CpxP family protein refolding chaperone